MTIRLRTLAALIILGIAGAAGFVYFGGYNIAATAQHTGPVFSLLDYALRKSVKQRSENIDVPDLSGEQRLRNGLAHYRSHCVQCHGAPGVAPDSFSYGMTPAPANLVATARHWPPEDLYWVIKHGIKMSGMPAWKYRLSDTEMWDIVAFVERMPALSPMDYQALSRQTPARHEHQAASGSEPATGRPSATGTVLGNAAAGKQAIQQYLCLTCHQVPGIVGANAPVGPPLNGMANRRYIAGIMPNTPENMVQWLRHPQQFDPLSAMPNLGVTEQDARDIAAFLYTLEDLD